jgi:hypothetical protein
MMQNQWKVLMAFRQRKEKSFGGGYRLCDGEYRTMPSPGV